MSMMKNRLVPTVVTATMILTMAAVTPLWTSETDADSPVGVEKYDAACQPGDPMTIETSSPGVGRVEITWLGCTCFDTAEAATAWIEGLGQEAMEGRLVGMQAPEYEHTMVAEPDPGTEVPLVAYCLTREQVVEYLSMLQPSETDLRDGS